MRDRPLPASDLWDWPATRPGKGAMALLSLGIIVLCLTPVIAWVVPSGASDDTALAAVIMPVLVAGACAVSAGALALAAIVVGRERAAVLWLAALAGGIVLAMFL